MRHLFSFALLAAVSTCASAQRMTSGGPHFSGRMSSHPFAGGTGAYRGHPGGGFPGGVYYPLGFGDALYSDYLQSTGYPVASQPNVFVMQPPAPAAAPAPVVATPPVDPLMIELRGDHYVQVSGAAKSNAQMIDQMPVAIASAKSPEQAASAKPAPSAVLVFRDGHDEEISDYTIVSGAIYARAEDYNPVNRKIELASLNLPETVKQNQSRGLRFQLPTYPNEVIVGP